MRLEDGELHVENDEDRRLCWSAAMAGTAAKQTGPMLLGELETPFTLGKDGSEIVLQGLGDIALGRLGDQHFGVSIEDADKAITDLYGRVRNLDFW
jgi:hypothetical protein